MGCLISLAPVKKPSWNLRKVLQTGVDGSFQAVQSGRPFGSTLGVYSTKNKMFNMQSITPHERKVYN